MAKEYKLPDFKSTINKIINNFHRRLHREINLVPDIKNEMIKTLKLRNLIFFLCVVVASASIGATLVIGTIVAGQSAIIGSKNGTIDNLSDKLRNYSELSDYITIKDQVNNIDTLTNNKKVLSRTFNILSAMLPTGADTITISELNVSLSDENPTISFDAQADAGTPPYIDYRVLDAFQKSMEYLTFDYGDYVDKNGEIIPAYCIIDTNSDGAKLRDDRNYYYGLWTIYAEGCDPSATTDEDGETISSASSYTIEDYEGQRVVRIWRTPQFETWYRTDNSEGQPMMTENGVITNVAHFESACINYKVELRDGQAVKLDDTNNQCKLVPENTEGGPSISISESSNGRSASDELVLRFSATITLDPDVYLFNNHHLIALAPSSRRNVTDSYKQIQKMFGERAADCAADDTACNSDTNLKGGN